MPTKLKRINVTMTSSWIMEQIESEKKEKGIKSSSEIIMLALSKYYSDKQASAKLSRLKDTP